MAIRVFMRTEMGLNCLRTSKYNYITKIEIVKHMKAPFYKAR
jgi:hypothetical protein